MPDKILCIDDDLATQALVRASFGEADLTECTSLLEASRLISKHRFDAVLLDLELPDGDGLRLLPELIQFAKRTSALVFILSGSSEISKKSMAFSFGVDDYIVKPFDPIELNMRVTSRIKKGRERASYPRVLSFGGLFLDLETHQAHVVVNGMKKDCALTRIEFQILKTLIEHEGQIFTRERLIEKIWNKTHVLERTVDTHIVNLRRKISGSNVRVVSQKNLGYQIQLCDP